MAPKCTWMLAEAIWRLSLRPGEQVDSNLPAFAMEEYRREADSNYAPMTDYRFHQREGDPGDFKHRPKFATGPVDLPTEDLFFGTDEYYKALEWARAPSRLHSFQGNLGALLPPPAGP